MTVYVVLSYQPGDDEVDNYTSLAGVFSTLEKAETFASGMFGMDITEAVVDLYASADTKGKDCDDDHGQ